MGKLIAILLVLGAVAGGAYYLMNQDDSGSDNAPAAKKETKENKDGVRVEEKYGFTSNTP